MIGEPRRFPLASPDRSAFRYTPPVQSPTYWIRRLKLRALGTMLAATVVVVALSTMMAMPWLATMGVAVAAAAVVGGAVHKITNRLHHAPACLSCGRDLAGQPVGVHGIACPDCGSIQSGSIRHLARLDEAQRAAPVLPASLDVERGDAS